MLPFIISDRRGTSGASFCTVFAALAVGGLCDIVCDHVASVVIGIFLGILLKPYKTNAGKKFWIVSCLFCGCICGLKLLPFLAIFIGMAESAGKDTQLQHLWTVLSEYMEIPTVISTNVGANSAANLLYMPVSGFVQNVRDIFDQGDTGGLFPRVDLEFLRPVDISANIKKIEDLPKIGVDQLAVIHKKTISKTRYTWVGLMVGVGCFLLHTPFGGLVVGMGLVVLYYGETVHSFTSRERPLNLFTDGIYRAKMRAFGVEYDHWIAVAYNGVMHMPYHAVGAMDIHIGGQTYAQYYSNSDEDVASYGGLPQFSDADEDEVFVSLERDTGRETYRVPVLGGVHGFSYLGFSKPGDSGSPVWKRSGEGLTLVGLAGRWVNHDGKNQEEFVVKPAKTEPAEPIGVTYNMVEKIIKHPGFGKTRTIVPAKIDEHLKMGPGKWRRVILLGPTRVVCRELYTALRAKYGQEVTLHIKGSTSKTFGRICIMAHHTYWEMSVKNEALAHQPTMIIIDEAHARDLSTKCLRIMTEKVADKIKVIWMTATDPPDYDDGSRFPIMDRKLNPDKMDEVIEHHLREGLRVGIFLPSVLGKNGVEAVGKKWQAVLREDGLGVVRLHRGSYEDVNAKGLLQSADYPLIVMTNIAEMGINPDLDVVVNTSTEFVFVKNGPNVVAQTRRIGRASHIQRRGRVGRMKSGIHYYLEEPAEDNEGLPLAIDQDAREILKGTMYLDLDPGETAMTTQQRIVVAEHDLPPRFVRLFYTRRGNVKSGEALSEAIDEWRDGTVMNTCEKKKCPCVGKCKWVDERSHDALVKLLG